MTLARKVTQNTITQIIGRVIGLIVTLVTVSFVTNNLIVDGSAPIGFGQYTIVFTYSAIIGTAADLGLFTLLVRELVGKNRVDAGKILGSAIWFRAFLFVAALLLAALLLWLLPYDEIVRQGIFLSVVVAFTLLFSQIFASVFQANLDSPKIVITETAGKVVILAATIFAIRYGYGLIGAVIANIIGNLITLVWAYWLSRRYVLISSKLDLGVMKKYIPQLLPIAIISLLGLAHFKLGVILLSFLKDEGQVGIYGISFKLIEVALIIPYIISSNLLPILSTMFMSDSESLAPVVKKTSQAVFYAGSICTVFLLAFAPLIVVTISNESFLSATLPLRILSVAMLFAFVTTFISQAAIAVKKQNVLIPVYICVLVIDIVLGVLLIQNFSYIGAAITALTSEFVLLIWLAVLSKSLFGTKSNLPILQVVKLLLLGILSGALSVALIRTTFSVSWFIQLGSVLQLLLLLLILAVTIFISMAVIYLVCGRSLKRIKSEFFSS